MTFYWKPPRGCLELDEIMECVQQRMQLISSVIDDRPPGRINLSYFVEGTAIDRASHYLLRLATLSSAMLRNFVVRGECELFKKRLSFFESHQVNELLSTSLRHLDEIISSRLSLDKVGKKFLTSSIEILRKLVLKKGGIDHAFGMDHPAYCSKYKIIVPFKYCLPLIAQRQVDLKGGFAWVDCSCWADLLVSMFRLHLLHGYEDLNRTGCNLMQQDARIHHLSSMIEAKYMQRPISFIATSSQEMGDHLTCDNIAERQKLFPPCVRSLIGELKTHHRLGHHARVQLTLFLKEAGMPVKEAIAFWRREYSTPSTKCGPNCSHSWQKDERKYVYSIRHLYGLEGARTNYSAPMCSSLQGNLLAPGVAGGCPFARLAEKPLLELLEQYQLHPGAKSLILSYSDVPSKGCNALLKNMIDVKEDSVFKKPSQFYFRCKNWAYEF